ncbi:MAG TPA: thiamine phosphate synthase [Chloroflexota bacterium]|nr:thiamine phosphate synthase [Chloroflexota bacterium]
MNEERQRRLTVLRDAGLYLVTDDRQAPAERRRVVEAALRAGVRVVQLRDKRSLGGALLREAEELLALCRAHDALLIVNDRVDVAAAVGAHGVHVGQEDLPLAAVRRLVPPEMLVGVSASTVAEAVAADRAGADYIGFGALFPTDTKRDAEYAGPARLREVLAAVRCPVVAIGGITAANLPEVLAAGARLVAVVSAVSAAADPYAAARALLAAVRAGAPRGV